MEEKKKFVKNNFISFDVIFSIFVILSIIAIITIVCTKINLELQIVRKKARAIIIITNIVENINSRNYTEFEKYIQEISMIGISKKMETNFQNIIVDGNECNETFLGTQIPNGYVLELEIDGSKDIFSLEKQIKINIKFLVGSSEYNQKITTSIESEKISECNSPIISDEYFEPLGISTYYYNIIPIKYSNEEKAYVKTTIGDKEWYNYSAKEWARVLVFLKDGEDIEGRFINSNGVVKNIAEFDGYSIDVNNYMYVWIPNFSIKENTSYFRYKTGKNVIKMDLSHANDKILNINTVGENVEDVSKTCSFEGIYGVWKKLGDETDEYYSYFNLTKYAPINMH